MERAQNGDFREIGSFSYIWVREEQDSGLPHLHILVSRYLPQDWLSRRWEELGGGEIVDIRQIERVEKAAHYIGKYLTKNALTGMPDGIRRYGSSSDIDLDVRGTGESGDDRQWTLVMDDYQLGDDEPLTRGVSRCDHVEQRQNGGPLEGTAVRYASGLIAALETMRAAHKIPALSSGSTTDRRAALTCQTVLSNDCRSGMAQSS